MFGRFVILTNHLVARHSCYTLLSTQTPMPSSVQLSRDYGSIALLPRIEKVFRRARECKLLERLRDGPIKRAEMVAVDYEIVKSKAEDATDILNFMLQDFLYKEPLNEAVNLKPEEAKQFFAEIVEAGISCPVNYVVRNNDGKIVALRWACIVRRDDASNDYTFESTNNDSNWKVNEIQRLLSAVEGKIWEVAPKEVNCLLSWLIISVDQSFTRRGIAAQLLTYRLDELREIGCQGMITTASAYNSQQLFQKMGYTELFAVELEDWKNAQSEQIFKCHDKTTKASLVIKLFE